MCADRLHWKTGARKIPGELQIPIGFVKNQIY